LLIFNKVGLQKVLSQIVVGKEKVIKKRGAKFPLIIEDLS